MREVGQKVRRKIAAKSTDEVEWALKEAKCVVNYIDAASEINVLKIHIHAMHVRLKTNDMTGWDKKTMKLAQKVAAKILIDR